MIRTNFVFHGKYFHGRAILLVGALFGFTTAIVAQYGVPMAHYKINGVVKSKDCNVPIPNIKVSLYNNTYQPNYDPYTDSLGRFELMFRGEYGDDLNNLKMIIEAEDEDSEANCGDFLTYEKVIMIKQNNKERKNKYSYESDEIIIEMDYKGKSSCKPELSEDTITKQKPPIQKLCVLSDSNITKPISTDIFSNSSQENTDTLNNDSRNKPPDMQNQDLLFVYPNPSKEQYTIKLSLEKTSIVSMTVYDSNSKLVLSESWGSCKGILQKQISLESKAPGTYYLIINAGNKMYTSKLVKQ